ncbi:MAG: cbb3-type cytochrome c oxidase N-terminal domain-containing protein [Planctomycetota bacterium]
MSDQMYRSDPDRPRTPPQQRPGEPDAELIEGHNYDGIQEYDNPTPGWWHAIFFATIVFSILYLIVYDISPLTPTVHERHASIESKALDKMFAELNNIPLGEEKLRAIMGQDKWLAMGASVYAQHCIVCHGDQGQGLVGPNMTDEVYLRVAELMDIATIVEDGANNGAMPAWKNRLNANEIALVSAYAASLRGTNIEGKEPEGEPIPAWPAVLSPDELQAAAAAAATKTASR